MDREKAFNEQLADEVSQNEDIIKKILNKSQVGSCGGKCRGYKEKTPDDLCEYCLNALEENADEIFSASPRMRLLGDAMNNRH